MATLTHEPVIERLSFIILLLMNFSRICTLIAKWQISTAVKWLVLATMIMLLPTNHDFPRVRSVVYSYSLGTYTIHLIIITNKISSVKSLKMLLNQSLLLANQVKQAAKKYRAFAVWQILFLVLHGPVCCPLFCSYTPCPFERL